MRLVAETDEAAIDLVVELRKPIVLQGDRGLSQKGPEPGNASFYYSATRLEARGSVTVGEDVQSVAGSAWLDREWSTSALSGGQAGWDWFAIQLDDGRELMLYRLRRADGTTRRLGSDDVSYEPLRWWSSALSGVSYPVEWQLRIDPLDLELETTPMIDASELDLSVRYWEGAIRASGREGSKRVSGRGFLEMTGYQKPVPGSPLKGPTTFEVIQPP